VRRLIVPLPFFLVVIGSAIATQPTNFAGEYTDRNFLNGQATFQMSLEQSASTVAVWFSAGYNDGHGLLPEADGSGKITPKGTVEFTLRIAPGTLAPARSLAPETTSSCHSKRRA